MIDKKGAMFEQVKKIQQERWRNEYERYYQWKRDMSFYLEDTILGIQGVEHAVGMKMTTASRSH